jgi:hypothetical protein
VGSIRKKRGVKRKKRFEEDSPFPPFIALIMVPHSYDAVLFFWIGVLWFITPLRLIGALFVAR